jgi:predicted DCC family thiol-disulfide oxidoreductase YuxK
MQRAEATKQSHTDGAVVFFDGYCGLCNRLVDFLLEHDKRRRLVFAPLDGVTAAQALCETDARAPDSIVYWDERGLHVESTAMVRILWRLGGALSGLGWVLVAVPRPIRNWGYRRVAAHRYRLFGRRQECRVPTPDDHRRFVD